MLGSYYLIDIQLVSNNLWTRFLFLITQENLYHKPRHHHTINMYQIQDVVLNVIPPLPGSHRVNLAPIYDERFKDGYNNILNSGQILVLGFCFSQLKKRLSISVREAVKWYNSEFRYITFTSRRNSSNCTRNYKDSFQLSYGII